MLDEREMLRGEGLREDTPSPLLGNADNRSGSGLTGDDDKLHSTPSGLSGDSSGLLEQAEEPESGLEGDGDTRLELDGERRLEVGGGGHEMAGGGGRLARSVAERWRDRGGEGIGGGRGGGGGPLPALPKFCCMRQWILNQLDRRPYLHKYRKC